MVSNVVLVLISTAMVTSEDKVQSFSHWSLTSFITVICIGFLSKLERATHIDFNGDNIIGRRPDVYYGGYPGMYGGGYPSMGYGGYGYGGSPYGYF